MVEVHLARTFQSHFLLKVKHSGYIIKRQIDDEGGKKPFCVNSTDVYRWERNERQVLSPAYPHHQHLTHRQFQHQSLGGNT